MLTLKIRIAGKKEQNIKVANTAAAVTAWEKYRDKNEVRPSQMQNPVIIEKNGKAVGSVGYMGSLLNAPTPGSGFTLGGSDSLTAGQIAEIDKPTRGQTARKKGRAKETGATLGSGAFG